MNFDNEKKQALAKVDRSKKGSVDVAIRPLVDLINSSDRFYTTSSCAGRIMLFCQGPTKKDAHWIFSSHDTVAMQDLPLHELPRQTVWLRMEPPILHICARTLKDADHLLKIANDSGFRRSCLLSFSKRIILEIMFPHKMDVPIARDSELIVDRNYLSLVLEYANARLRKARKRIKKFEELFDKQYNQQDQQQESH